MYGLSTYPLYSTAEFFIVKLDTDGNVLWAKGAQGNHQDAGEDLAIDINGNVYVSGSFQSSTLTFDKITINANKNANGDYLPSVFIAKYDGSGKLIWVKTCDSNPGSHNSMYSYGNYIATNMKGNIYLTGHISILKTSDQFTENAYLAKFDSEWNLLWSKLLEVIGFGNYSYSSGIVIDKLDKVFITGSFYHTLLIGRTTLSNISSYGNTTSI